MVLKALKIPVFNWDLDIVDFKKLEKWQLQEFEYLM